MILDLDLDRDGNVWLVHVTDDRDRVRVLGHVADSGTSYAVPDCLLARLDDLEAEYAEGCEFARDCEATIEDAYWSSRT